MIIEIYTKNLALVSTVEVPAIHVPRVGETITIGEGGDLLDADSELLVIDVTYIFKGQTLTPRIRCYGRNGETNRLELLVEQGWLHPQ